MSEAAEPVVYPYVTVMEPKYGPLETIEEKKIADACTHRWYNETLCTVNDAFVRMAVVEGEYHFPDLRHEVGDVVITVGRNHVDLVTQPQIQRKAGR